MCLGVPGQVIELTDSEHGLATVDVRGVHRTVGCQLLMDDEPPVPGDWLVVHMGMALERIEPDQARQVLAELEDPALGLAKDPPAREALP